MTAEPSADGVLLLEHVLAAADLDPDDVIVIRHVYRPEDDAVSSPEDLNDADKLRNYTARQGVLGRAFPLDPPRYWLVCIGEGRNARLLTMYENHGELDRFTWPGGGEGRTFDLRVVDLLAPYYERLTFSWSNARRWCFYGRTAAKGRIVSIADLETEPFPGFDHVLISHAKLREVVSLPKYAAWQNALESVQGIYLIADTSTGNLYVGMTFNTRGILGRWSDYAQSGTGGNKALRELVGKDANHAEKFQYSILRVFGPTTRDEIAVWEEHYKQALLSRMHGNNKN